jgi:hypothetical protein
MAPLALHWPQHQLGGELRDVSDQRPAQPCQKDCRFLPQKFCGQAEFEAKQKLLLPAEHQGHHLVQECETRWNSTLEMLKRLCEQGPAVSAVAHDRAFTNASHLKKFLFSASEAESVAAICQVLEPFRKATVKLSAEKTVSISSVLPSLRMLEAAVQEKADDEDLIKELKV